MLVAVVYVPCRSSPEHVILTTIQRYKIYFTLPNLYVLFFTREQKKRKDVSTLFAKGVGVLHFKYMMQSYDFFLIKCCFLTFFHIFAFEIVH